MTSKLLISRRKLLQTSAAGAALGFLPYQGTAQAATTTTVGFIYFAPKDAYGYNPAHA